MSTKSANHSNAGVFFITFTCFKWIPLFDIADAYKYVYKWFAHLIHKNHKIFAYVIMPNHVHLLLGKSSTDTTKISTIISNGKRFMAYDIVKQLNTVNRYDILSVLANGVNQSDKQRGKLHQVFEPSFDCKECYSLDFIAQKMNYIHANPLKGNYELVKHPADYIHSSARFYETGQNDKCIITNINWLQDNSL